MDGFKDESLIGQDRPTIDKATITVEMLDQLVQDIKTLKDEITRLEELTTELNKKKSRLEMTGVDFLKALEKDSYKCQYGSISIRKRWTVTLPQSPVDKQKFFDWLRAKGIFDSLATVNYMSLNSLYNAELEDAMRRGEGIEFSIPGIGPRTMFQSLIYLKGRN